MLPKCLNYIASMEEGAYIKWSRNEFLAFHFSTINCSVYVLVFCPFHHLHMAILIQSKLSPLFEPLWQCVRTSNMTSNPTLTSIVAIFMLFYVPFLSCYIVSFLGSRTLFCSSFLSLQELTSIKKIIKWIIFTLYCFLFVCFLSYISFACEILSFGHAHEWCLEINFTFSC